VASLFAGLPFANGYNGDNIPGDDRMVEQSGSRRLWTHTVMS
jgi:hypothetical protein